VNRADGIVTLEPSQSKNGHGRQFPFAAIDELRDVVNEQIASAERTGKTITRLFHQPGGSPISTFRKAWIAALQAFAAGKQPIGKSSAHVRQFRKRA